MRYKVIVVHGEYGSLWHVVDTASGEAMQPHIVNTYSRREWAEERCYYRNKREEQRKARQAGVA